MPRRPARRDGETLCRAVASDQSRRGRAESALRIYMVYIYVYRYRTTVGLRTQRSELDRLLIVFRCHARARRAPSKGLGLAPRLAIEACRPVRRRTLGRTGERCGHTMGHTRTRGTIAPGPGGTSAGAAASGGVPQGSRRAGVQRRRNGTRPRHRAIDHRAICRFAGHIDLVVPVVVPRPRTMAAWAFLGAAPPPVERSKTTVRRAADVCRPPPGRRVARRRTRYTRAAEATPGTPGARGPGGPRAPRTHAHVLGPSHDAPRIGVATAARGVRTPNTIKTAPRPPAAAMSAPSMTAA